MRAPRRAAPPLGRPPPRRSSRPRPDSGVNAFRSVEASVSRTLLNECSIAFMAERLVGLLSVEHGALDPSAGQLSGGMGLRTKAVEAPCSTSTWGAVALTAGRWVPPLRRPLSRPTRTRTVGGPLMVRHPRPTFVFGDCRSRTHAATRGPARRCPRRHERRARRPARRPPSVSPTAVCRSVRGRGPVYRQAPLHWDLAGCNNTQVVVPAESVASHVQLKSSPSPARSRAEAPAIALTSRGPQRRRSHRRRLDHAAG